MIDRCQLQWHRGRGTGHWGNCNSNGATGHWGNSNRTVLQQQLQLQWQWQWRSYFDRDATSTGRRRSIDRNYNGTGAGALGQEQQQLQLQWQWQWGNDRSCFTSQHKTSTIVVGESVQTVCLTNIPDVLCCD
jgi:hypothetical protein